MLHATIIQERTFKPDWEIKNYLFSSEHATFLIARPWKLPAAWLGNQTANEKNM
jgi:hypothetical protein